MTGGPMRVGDARNLAEAAGLAPETVDCVLTSPPYWRLKRYADGDAREMGQEASRDEYVEAIGDVFRQCFELAKPDGVMWLVVDTLREDNRRPGLGEMVPLPFELAEVARGHGWRFQDIVIWRKNKTLPYSGTGKLRNLIEYVLFFTKSGHFKHRPYRCASRHMPGAEWMAGWPERYHPLGRRPSNVWDFDIDTQGIWDHSERLHYCPFPQGLVARCLELTTDKDDLVLDPFAGIGTVPAQAIAMGRRAVGVELNPRHAQLFQERVLPDFQADWEADREYRRLAREDQREEALTILRLRCLKAGKELVRLCERLAREGVARHPAHGVEGVVVLEPHGLESVIDVEAGQVARPRLDLALVGTWSDDGRNRLLGELATGTASPPFTTFQLDITLETVAPEEINALVGSADLLEFGQSRKGAFTSPLDERLFVNRPKFLTTIRLKATVEGDKVPPIERARRKGERDLLEREVASGASLSEIAMRIGLPQAELHDLLERHGFVDEPRSFAISLPVGQLPLPT